MKSAIITLDIINDLCHQKGKAAKCFDRIESKKILKNINQITQWGRKKKHLIIHVRLAFRESYLDSSTKSPLFSKAKKAGTFNLNEWGAQFCDALTIEKNDITIIKHRVSAFYGTDLELILRANQIEHLIITGIVTNNAVELTAREAHDRDFVVTLIEDATECSSDEEFNASKNFLSRICKWSKTSALIHEKN